MGPARRHAVKQFIIIPFIFIPSLVRRKYRSKTFFGRTAALWNRYFPDCYNLSLFKSMDIVIYFTSLYNMHCLLPPCMHLKQRPVVSFYHEWISRLLLGVKIVKQKKRILKIEQREERVSFNEKICKETAANNEIKELQIYLG